MATMQDIQLEISNILESADEFGPDMQAACDAYLSELAGQEAAKVDNFVAYVRDQQSRMDFLKKEAERLRRRARNIEASLDYLKSHYLQTMQDHGIKKLAGNAYNISMRTSKSVDITCTPDKLPEIYCGREVVFTPRKTAIRDALERGEVIDGCAIVERPYIVMK